MKKTVEKASEKIVDIRNHLMDDSPLKDEISFLQQDDKKSVVGNWLNDKFGETRPVMKAGEVLRDKKVKYVNSEVTTWRVYLRELIKSGTGRLILMSLLITIIGLTSHTLGRAMILAWIFTLAHMGLIWFKNRHFIKMQVSKASYEDNLLMKTDGKAVDLLAEQDGTEVSLEEGIVTPIDIRVIDGRVTYLKRGSKTSKVITERFIPRGSRIVKIHNDDAKFVVSRDRDKIAYYDNIEDLKHKQGGKVCLRSKVLHKSGMVFSFLSVLLLLAILGFAYLYGLSTYNTVYNILTAVVCLFPMTLMFAVSGVKTLKGASFSDYINRTLLMGTADKIVMQVDDILCKDKMDIEFVDINGKVISADKINSEQGRKFIKYLESIIRTEVCQPLSRCAVDILENVVKVSAGKFEGHPCVQFMSLDMFEKHEELFKLTEKYKADGYMVGVCTPNSEDIDGLIVFKHYVDTDIIPVIKGLMRRGMSFEVSTAEFLPYVEAVQTQVEKRMKGFDGNIVFNTYEDDIVLAKQLTRRSNRGEAICFVGDCEAPMIVAGRISHINDARHLESIFVQSKRDFKFFKNIAKYMLACGIGKYLSIMIATVMGINIFMPLEAYLLTDLMMVLPICVIAWDNKSLHRTGSTIFVADDIVQTGFNSVLLCMCMIFSYIMMLRFEPINTTANAEFVTMCWVMLMQMVILIVTWGKSNLVRFLVKNVTYLVICGASLLMCILAFKDVRVTILGLGVLGGIFGLNTIYNALFRQN